MCVRTIRLVALLVALICLGSVPALTQTGQQRVQLVMSKLPSKQSPTYKALEALADNPVVQALSLTKSEIWSVPAEKVDAVIQAATRRGVSAQPLSPRTAAASGTRRRTRGPIPEAAREPREDWNQVFRLAPADVKMNDKQKQMIEIAKASRSTVGVVVMEAPFAPVVEYALTRDSGGQTPSKDSAKIIVTLSQSTVLTINRARVDIKPSMCIWHGNVEGTEAPATIVWWPDGKMAGSVQHQGRLYSIRHLGGEMHAVVEMSDERMPQEHATMPARLKAGDPNLRDDPLVNQGDASTLRPPTKDTPHGKRPQTLGSNKSEPLTAVATKPRRTATKPHDKSAALPKDIVIDVIVAYTKKAASNYSDVKRELVDLSIEDANESFRRSGIGNVKLRLVHAYRTDYVEDGSHFDHLWRFADKRDGYMEEIHPLREKYRADVGVLIVDDPEGCGLATRVFADQDEAFAVVHHECAASSYSLAHEIGHIIGARHDLNLDKTMNPFPYGHGYVNGTKWRDIMSYKASCNGCPRLPIWSSPKVLVKGEAAGTPDLDNARVIVEQATRVAAFRQSSQGEIKHPTRRRAGVRHARKIRWASPAKGLANATPRLGRRSAHRTVRARACPNIGGVVTLRK
jgi:Metallo-peptidase family M12